MVAAAIDALPDYATQAQINTSISDALVPYYTAAQVDAEIAANGADLSDYYTKTESDNRYFVRRAGGGNVSLVRDNVTPPTIRNLLPRAPLSTTIQFSGTVVELKCDAYSKSESDGRYLVQNGNAGDGGIFQMVLTNQSPPMIRAVLPRPPLTATLELNCDCWAKAETYSQAQADAAFAPVEVTANNNFAAIQAIDTRVTALEGSGGVPSDISCNSLTASSFVQTLNFTATGNTTGTDAIFTTDVQTPILRPVSGSSYLTVATGLTGIRFADENNTQLAELNDASLTLEPSVQLLTFNSIFADTPGAAGLVTSGFVKAPAVEPINPGSDPFLDLNAGTTAVRIRSSGGTTGLASFGLAENYMGGAPKLRVDNEIYIDDVSGTSNGLFTNAVTVRPQDSQLTLTGGAGGILLDGNVYTKSALIADTSAPGPAAGPDAAARGHRQRRQPGPVDGHQHFWN